MRPVLSPATRRLWRDRETLQFGRTPDRAVVLAGLDAGARAVLSLLDGTREAATVVHAAVALGCPAQRANDLLRLLSEAGLLLDAGERWPPHYDVLDRDRLAGEVAVLGVLHKGSGLPALRRRDQAAVTVIGGGRVGAPLAGLLAAAGVGSVDVSDDGTARPQDVAPGGLALPDVGRRRGPAAREHLKAGSPTTRTDPVARPDLVVLAPTSSLDPADVRALERQGTPHLLVEVRDTVGVVGPLVLPGRTACLGCLDLDRAERDPGWPTVAGQLATAGNPSTACDGVLAAAVAAQGALQVLALLDRGEPATVGGSLELALPDWRWRRRSWLRHPACACRWEATG